MLTRRSFCQAGVSAAAGLLTAGCGSRAVPVAASQQTLNVFNWSDYIDPALLREFEQYAGCKVQYDNYASDTELEGKVLSGSAYDVIVPSDRSLSPLLKKGVLAELQRDLLPNFKHLDAKFLNPPPDPGNRYTVPYFWGTVAVGLRTDHVAEPVKGFEVLFNEKYKNRITMLNDAETVVAICMLHLGFPINSTEDAHLDKVKELLVQQRPLVQAYTSDGFKEKLLKDEAWVALGWSGDILQARKEENKVKVVVPEAGTMVWTDNLAVLKSAKNVALAHQFINYLLDPDVAARNANFVRYPSPNAAARPKIAADLLNDPTVYLPPALLDKCQRVKDRGAAMLKIERVWNEVRT